jgi:hypothetical protein
MLKNFRSFFMLFLAVTCVGPVLAAADPTVDEVYTALRAGQVVQAEQMMTRVLADHPQSAQAHYVAAQVYARAGDIPTARQELSTAQRLKPGLPFVRAESVEELQRELTQARVPMRPSESRLRAPFPTSTVLLVVGAIAVLWMLFRRRTAAANVYPQYPSGAMPAGAGMGPSYGGAGMGAGLGSGIAGGLASGLAVGAGVVAGEELARHFLDRPGGAALPDAVAPAAENGDTGGNDFGVSDANSWDDGGDWS